MRTLSQLLLLLMLLIASFGQESLALEFLDVDESVLINEDSLDSAELPSNFHSYSRDTIANPPFNAHKQDARFHTQWERIPLQKPEIIKR